MSTIEEQVIEKIRQRAEAGLKKYGVTVERKDLSFEQWLVHAQEEAMDFAVYIQRLIEERKTQAATVRECGSCVFWQKKISGSDWAKGECRRHSPFLNKQAPEGFDTKEWPRTDNRDSCGDWAAK